MFKRLGRRYGVIQMDIDTLKEINDRLGHAVGDGAIRFVADILSDNAREMDVTARYGGDEFVIICSLATPDDLTVYGRRLVRLIHDSRFALGRGRRPARDGLGRRQPRGRRRPGRARRARARGRGHVHGQAPRPRRVRDAAPAGAGGDAGRRRTAPQPGQRQARHRRPGPGVAAGRRGGARRGGSALPLLRRQRSADAAGGRRAASRRWPSRTVPAGECAWCPTSTRHSWVATK